MAIGESEVEAGRGVGQNITQFRGRYRFLSNFWPAHVMLDGYSYPSVEHAYQAAKFPHQQREPFRNLELRPGEAKRLGRGKAPAGWKQHSLDIMFDLVWQKFEEPVARKQLMATGNAELIEGNDWHDTFYGICYGECRSGPHNPIGENQLGKILMDVRLLIHNSQYPRSL